MSNTATLSYGWSIKGKQPIIDCKQRGRERRTVMGTLNYRTGQMTINVEVKGNSLSFIKHLRKINRTYKTKEKIILILDNVRFHHARKVKSWLKLHPKFEIIYLPPYSPNLNPIERVWWYMRKKITHNRFVIDMKQRLKLFWKMFSKLIQPNMEMLKVCVINF